MLRVDLPAFFCAAAEASAPQLHLFSGRSLACLAFACAHLRHAEAHLFDRIEEEVGGSKNGTSRKLLPCSLWKPHPRSVPSHVSPEL